MRKKHVSIDGLTQWEVDRIKAIYCVCSIPFQPGSFQKEQISFSKSLSIFHKSELVAQHFCSTADGTWPNANTSYLCDSNCITSVFSMACIVWCCAIADCLPAYWPRAHKSSVCVWFFIDAVASNNSTPLQLAQNLQLSAVSDLVSTPFVLIGHI